jgi:hypothetical protein
MMIGFGMSHRTASRQNTYDRDSTDSEGSSTSVHEEAR